MQFKTTLLFSALAALVAADYQAILTALATLDADTAKLNTSVLAFDGSNILVGIPILADTNTLQNDLKSATTTANNLDPLTNDQALGLLGPVTQLSKDSNITITSLINAYPAFKKNSLTGIVKSNLQTSKTDADAFSAALISKVPSNLQAAASNIAAPIDASFAQAIAVYSQGDSIFGF